MVKNKDIAKAFYYGEEEKTKNFYTEDLNGVVVAFSYGNHFPIAFKFEDGFIFNLSGYSNTTARHKNLILSYIKDELKTEDYFYNEEMKNILSSVRYNDLKSKKQYIESKI